MKYKINTIINEVLPEIKDQSTLWKLLNEKCPHNLVGPKKEISARYICGLAFQIFLSQHDKPIRHYCDDSGLLKRGKYRMMIRLRNFVRSSELYNKEDQKIVGPNFKVYFQNDSVFYIMDHPEPSYEKIHYDSSSNSFYLYSKRKGRVIQLPEDLARSIKFDYSSDGGGMTCPEISEKYDEDSAVIREIIKTFGWTHSSFSLLDKDLEEKDEEEWADLHKKERERYARNAVKKNARKKQKEKAKKWDHLNQEILQRTGRLFKGYERPSNVRSPLPNRSVYPGEYLSVIGLMDAHLGLKGWSDNPWDDGFWTLEEAKSVYAEKTEALICRLSAQNVSSVVLPIGSDFFDFDSTNLKTVRGTEQEVDTDFFHAVKGGVQLSFTIAERLASVFNDVRIHWVRGNHDESSSQIPAYMLWGWSKHVPNVTVDISAEPQSVFSWGNNLIGLAHGDGARNKKSLRHIFTNDHRDAWGETNHATWITGHKHHEKIIDNDGVSYIQVPTLVGSDKWHKKKVFSLCRRSLDAYVFEKNRGRVGILSEPMH